MNNIISMKNLIERLNKASSLYYNTGNSPLSDKEFDSLLERLREMEESTGVIYANSPTQKVGAPVLSNIRKIKVGEFRPMLSLAKVHSQEEIDAFAKGKSILGMIKADGLSIRIKYVDGKIDWASTRGNGAVGSDITEHIKHFINVPLNINVKGNYIIDGEAIIKSYHFVEQGDYANPRNLAAGTLNLLDMSVVKSRKLSFIAWDVISGDDSNFLSERLDRAEDLGFEVIYRSFDASNEEIIDKAKMLGIPCDGVVWKFDDIAYGNSLGNTSHHFNSGIAWKPEDETANTQLIRIEWGIGRTGVLTPVAIFEPVELEGSVVERASLHNITVMYDLLGKPYIGQEIEIYKANQIIPQISQAIKRDWLVDEQGIIDLEIPSICPICGGPLARITEVESEALFCQNPECEGKLVNRLEHFCSKKGLDIKGLSKATLEKLVDWGWVNEFKDLYHLNDYYTEWINKPGFGQKSVDNILSKIEESRIVTLSSFIAAIGIPHVGNTLAKDLCNYIDSYEDLRNKVQERWDFTRIDGIGLEKQYAILSFDYSAADRVAAEMASWTTAATSSRTLEGMTIVITGRLTHFANRDAFINAITERGGRVVGSVSRNTTILVNNDTESNSSKNRTAKELGIPILSEEKFLAEYLLM